MISEDASKIQEIIEQSNLELKSIEVDKEIPIECDLANLLASDINELDKSQYSNKETEDKYFKDLARDGVQCIINGIWDLPSETIDNMIYATMPKPKYRLPREKPLPKKKPPTKWEIYAKEKGIKNKKKYNKVWDEVLQDWIPRYGFKKAQAEKAKNWVIEVPHNANPMEDQFEKLKTAKKERVARNEFLRLRNIAKANNIVVPKVRVTSENIKGKKDIKSALELSRVSTASLGKFQKTLKSDQPLKETKRGQKRKLPDNDVSKQGLERDKKTSLEVLEKMKKSDLHYESAVNKQIKLDNIEESQRPRKNAGSKRRSKHGGRKRGKSEQKALVRVNRDATSNKEKGLGGRKKASKSSNFQDSSNNSKRKFGKSKGHKGGRSLGGKSGGRGKAGKSGGGKKSGKR